MSDWVHIQARTGEQLMQLHQFSFTRQQPGGDVTFAITVKEYAVSPPGQRVRFYAQADKQVYLSAAPFLHGGWGSSLVSALGHCVPMIREFPYEGEKGRAA